MNPSPTPAPAPTPSSSSLSSPSVTHHRRIDRQRLRRERDAVKVFWFDVHARWLANTTTTNTTKSNSFGASTVNNPSKPWTLFPLTREEEAYMKQGSAESSSWKHWCQQVGLGVLAGTAAVAAIRAPKWRQLVTNIRKPHNSTHRSFPFSPDCGPTAKKNKKDGVHHSLDWLERIMDVLLFAAVTREVALLYDKHRGSGTAVNINPAVEAFSRLPAVAPDTSQTSSSSKNKNNNLVSSVIVHQVCPVAVDLYRTSDPLLQDRSFHPHTPDLEALQRFVRNCERRGRVEQSKAWQERQFGF